MRRKGRILKRGKHTWAVVLYLGRDPETKKEKRKWYTFSSQHDAERFLHQCLASGPGVAPPNTRLRLGAYLEQWLSDYEQIKNLAPSTRRNYSDAIRVHLRPALGHVALQRLSPVLIEHYISSTLRAGKLSSTSVQYQFGVLREALHHAVRKGLIARNPCDVVARPRRARTEMRVLDEEQARLFLAEARRSSPYYRLYLAAVLTGMRQGELLGLRWQDVDLTLGVASIQQTFYRLGKQQLFKAPKSEKGRRSVALAPALVEELRALRSEQHQRRLLLGSAHQDHDLIFCQHNGNPLHGHNITGRDLRAVLKRAKLPRVRFHDLRHSHATHLLRQGVNPKVVQERLGHSTPAFTLQVYSHVLPGMQEEAARIVAERLLGKAAETDRKPEATREQK